MSRVINLPAVQLGMLLAEQRRLAGLYCDLVRAGMLAPAERRAMTDRLAEIGQLIDRVRGRAEVSRALRSAAVGDLPPLRPERRASLRLICLPEPLAGEAVTMPPRRAFFGGGDAA